MATFEKLLAEKGAGVEKYRAGDKVIGTVVDANPSRVLLELPGGITGIITKKEASAFGDGADDYDAGMQLEAAIIEAENDHGLVVMSLRRASQDMIWAELAEIQEEERTVKVKIDEANKGGLMAKYKGLRSFLPVSQLTPNNYPRVNNADAAAILAKLQEHVGKEFHVRVINVDRERGKVIISEKAAHAEQAKETMEKINIGDVVKGHVSGVVKFGIFVTFGGIEGLVHLSELSWSHIGSPDKHYQLGDEVEVLIIGIEGTKLSFSIKQLQEDPWKENVKAYEVGSMHEAKVVKWNSQGVVVEIKRGIDGLISLDQFPVEVHTELPTKANIREGILVQVEVLAINEAAHRLDFKLIG